MQGWILLEMICKEIFRTLYYEKTAYRISASNGNADDLNLVMQILPKSIHVTFLSNSVKVSVINLKSNWLQLQLLVAVTFIGQNF